MAIARHHKRLPSIPQFDLELEVDDHLDLSKFSSTVGVLSELLTATESCFTSDEQRRLLYDAREAHALAVSPGGEVSLEAFAQYLALRGFMVWLRTGRPDCYGSQVALRHTFVVAGMPGSPADPVPQLFVVDPCFRDSFQLPNATPQYQALWEGLPSLFVGTAEQLVPIVELMCAEMQQVFADTAASCPPWRTAACMITKWLPAAADDVPVVAHAGAVLDSDSSTQTSATPTNSALSSPIAGGAATAAAGTGGTVAGNGCDTLFGVPGVALLAPIRTGTTATEAAAAAAESGLTPHTARSPLYYDHDQHMQGGHQQLQLQHQGSKVVAGVGLLSPGASEQDTDRKQLLQAHYPPVGALSRDAFVVCLDCDQDVARDAALAPRYQRRSMDSSYPYGDPTVASGADGSDLGYASASSSPGLEPALLRSCFSEDGSSRPSDCVRGVAIVPRRHTSFEPGPSTSGFGEAFAARSAMRHALRFSPGAVLPCGSEAAANISKAAAAAAAIAALPAAFREDMSPFAEADAGRVGGAARGGRGFFSDDRASLDISRFDRAACEDELDDLALPPLMFGLAGLRLGSSSGSGSRGHRPASSVPTPPAARMRGSSGLHSQCSALSAAIAGSGLPAR